MPKQLYGIIFQDGLAVVVRAANTPAAIIYAQAVRGWSTGSQYLLAGPMDQIADDSETRTVDWISHRTCQKEGSV